MALIYMNGFEWNSVYENIHTQSGMGISSSRPRSGSYGCVLAVYDWVRLSTFTPASEFYFQIAFRAESPTNQIGNSETPFLRFRYGPGLTVLGTLCFNTLFQRLSAFIGDSSVMLGQSAYTLAFSKWYVLEFYWKFASDSSGRLISRVDGNIDISYTGNTQYGSVASCSSIDIFMDYGIARYFTFYVDDIVINDTTGSYNTSWPNGARVLLKHPNGKGSSSQWQKNPSTTIDNYSCVDGWPSWDPTEYTFTDQDAQLDLFTFPSLPEEASSILAVRPDAWVQKNSGTAMQIRLAVLPPGGTVITSSAQNLYVSYNLQQNVWESNPYSLAAWTPADINELEAGYKSVV